MTLSLEKHPDFGGVEGPVVVVVMDGVGIGKHDESDAVWLARTPHLDALEADPSVPSIPLAAHGRAVGLPSD
ncbi:MAG: 2,3-bisphosphoglycerate-independent phosphoglycerate mutase, partial [Sandaracinaceae bacterium]